MEPNQYQIKPYADVGTSAPFVSRIHGLCELIDAGQYDDNTARIKEGITIMLTECLIPAFLSLRELRSLAGKENVPELTKVKEYDSLYGKLWTAYKDRMQAVARLMGFDVGFIFASPNTFSEAAQSFAAANPRIPPDFITMVEGDRRSWQQYLSNFRNNFLEHQKIERNTIKHFYSLGQAEISFENVWHAIEEIIALLAESRFPAWVRLRELSPEERISGNEKRFGYAMIGPATE